MKILCIGQSAYDITLPVDSYPEENKKIKIGNRKIECGGGSANNCAYLLGLWNCDVSLASPIGKDFYGEKIKEELRSVNVNLDYFYELDVETTTSFIITNLSKGTRTIITNKSDFMKYPENFLIDSKYDVILCDGNDSELAIKTIKNNPNAISILDAGGIKKGTLELCKYVDYIVCSNDFAKDFTKINFSYDDLETIKKVHQLISDEFKTNVIITLESFGSFTKINNEYELVPSIKMNCVDSTGAGDIYHGAFTYFISHGYSLKDTLRLSNVAGALSVRYIGSKPSMPKLEEVLNYHEL